MNKIRKKTSASASGPISGEDEERLEVIDARDRPLMIMPRGKILQFRLDHRIVLVGLRDQHNRVYIQKRAARKSIFPGYWCVSAAGHVLAGESRLDAALRELEEELGVSGLDLEWKASTPASAETGHAHMSLFLSAPAGGQVRPNPKEVDSGIFMDQDELESMLRDMPELLTPSLLWAFSTGYLFE